MDNVALVYGGNYNFYNCDFVDSNSLYINHTSPVLVLSNFFNPNGTGGTNYISPLTANFYNSIIYGDISNGNEVDTASLPGGFSYNFDHCLVTTNLPTPASRYNTCLINVNPLFINPPAQNYILNSNSPCISNGDPIYEKSPDLAGQNRTQADIGCYAQ
jgi:hypothetical protein